MINLTTHIHWTIFPALWMPFQSVLFFKLSYIAKRLRVNEQIRARTIRLINEAGEQQLLETQAAIQLARQSELDLVEVAPNVDPPVCKLMDYGKYLYRQEKADRKHRAQQKQTEVKGIRMSFRTGPHDIEVKAKQARKFLESRNVVKVSLLFRGREAAYVDLAKGKMLKFHEFVQDIAKMEDPPKKQGNTLFMILSPIQQIPKDN